MSKTKTEAPTEIDWKKVFESQRLVYTSPVGKAVSRFMCLLLEIDKAAKEIVDGAKKGNSAWHREYGEKGDEYTEGFLADVAAIGRLCHSMEDKIQSWERTWEHRYWAELKDEAFEYFKNEGPIG
jgi:hypothetical protein